ncbi:peptidyl-prolyl cis-trans isomerase [Xanthomarina sp. F1114]|uniref:peptidyl-prolyl cis-trans isomerase n=1 Tax=Xanthomarina sp. F1114 TaxID=2996019 RepID=UPI00225E229A|nr:peptidyl-prolyl cis-trans isomerase [Xanthomarina sp. F1114]MCX7547478.1 peptidyl-prolyl cis-trans isomerase [Xanthomarina sp. F1114]
MKFKTNILFLCAFVWLFVSCDFFKETDDRKVIARVNDINLYEEDIRDLIKEGMSPQDSAMIVSNFINRWATQQLLLSGAKTNLTEAKQKSFDKLAKEYKNDLYSKAYLEALVVQNIDTVIAIEEIEAYYNENKEVFKLNEDLIKLRYINIDENRLDLKDLETKFKRFNEEDKKELDSISIQFKSFSLKDSVWVKVDQVVNKIPPITSENRNELLKKSNFIQLKDSLGLYLVHISDVLLRNSTAPMEYVKPTIDKIVINKRKLELVRELEKDIKTDAIKHKKFEIYN